MLIYTVQTLKLSCVHFNLFPSNFGSKTERIARFNGYKRRQNVHVQTLYG